MKLSWRLLNLVLCLILFSTMSLFADNIANAPVYLEIKPISEISTSGNPSPFIIDSVSIAGEEPDEVSNSATSYNITCNGTNKKIQASINPALSSWITLKVNLTAPPGATSSGDIVLTTTPKDVVTGITRRRATGLGITYKCSITVEGASPGNYSTVVTFTVVDG